MNRNKIALGLFAVLLTATLFIPGCDELITEVNNTTLVDSTLGIGCFDCHSDEDNILLRPKGQYENSAHASDYPLDRFHNVHGEMHRVNECGKQCHSHEGFIQTFDSISVSSSDLSVIGCFTCHLPHTGKYGEWDADSLRAAREYVFTSTGDVYAFGKSNMCVHCHQAPSPGPLESAVGEVTLTYDWGPHRSGQADLFLSKGGFLFDTPDFDSAQIAVTHAGFLKNSDGCITCHFSDGTGINGIGYQFGEHTFRLTDFDGPDSVIFDGNCSAACHTSVASAYDLGRIRAIDSLQNVLKDSLLTWNYLDTLDDEGWSYYANASIAADAARILYNYLLVKGDGSRGVHNPTYAQTLLTNSIAKFGEIPPLADFDFSTSAGCSPLTVDFTDLSLGNPYQWDWTFGDGVGVGTGANPTYVYDSVGTFNVTLTARNDFGSKTITKTGIITVFETQVNFSVSPSYTCDTSLTVNFTDLSPGVITAWSWDFGDGSPLSTESIPTHEYTNPGSYDVSLTVADSCGSAFLTKTSAVFLGPPLVDFAADTTSIVVGEAVAFTNLTLGAGTGTVWAWDFGNGTTSTLQHPTATYNLANTYTVSLTVTNDCDEPVTTTKTNYITVSEP